MPICPTIGLIQDKISRLKRGQLLIFNEIMDVDSRSRKGHPLFRETSISAAFSIVPATSNIMKSPIFRMLIGLSLLVLIYFCVKLIYIATSAHSYADAGFFLSLIGLLSFLFFLNPPIHKIVYSWASIITIEAILFTTGVISIVSIYWIIKRGAYDLAFITLLVGGVDLLFGICMVLRAKDVIHRR